MLRSAKTEDEFIELLPEIILKVADYLDYISLYYLCLTCLGNCELLDVVWENHALVHAPERYLTTHFAFNPQYAFMSHQHFFRTAYKEKYAHLADEQKQLHAYVANNDFESIKAMGSSRLKKILQGKGIPLILSVSSDDEIKHYIFDQLEISESLDLIQLIVLGIRHNLSKGRFREHVIYFRDNLLLGPDEVSFLYLAAARNSRETVAMLLELGMNAPGAEETSPLYLAAQEGFLGIVKLLVANKADIEFSYRDGFTPLYIAAQMGRLEIVKFLHEKGAKINITCRNGSSPLYIAMQEGKFAVVDYLLTQGAKHNTDFRAGFTPLYVGARNGHLACVERLLAEKPRVDAHDLEGSTPLYVAAQNGKHEICGALLEAGANAESKFLSIYTALYIASQNGHDKVVYLLCSKRPDLLINYVALNGSTALYVAAENGNLECVKILLQFGADANIGYLAGYTPLYVAAQKGHYSIVETLLKYGADVNRKTRRGATSLYVATQNKHKDIIQLLLSYGADTNLAFENGCTALHVACCDDDIELSKLLFQYGANPFIKDKEDRRAFELFTDDALKGTFRVLGDEKFNRGLHCTRTQPSLLIRKVVRRLESSAHRFSHASSLLHDASSDFARFVILFSILKNLEKNHPLVQDLIHALGVSSCEAKDNLYNVLAEYLGNAALLNHLIKHVVLPLKPYLKAEDKIESAGSGFISNLVKHARESKSHSKCDDSHLDAIMLRLAYFEGQVYLALPLKLPANHAKPQYEMTATKLSSTDIVYQINEICELYKVKHQAANMLAAKLNGILTKDISENDKIDEIRQATVVLYYRLRMANSNNAFFACSQFGDELENVCKNLLACPVPHFIPKGSEIPVVNVNRVSNALALELNKPAFSGRH